MKIFISWSGEVSEKIAKLLKEFIPGLFQEAEVFMSSEDIEKGKNWDAVLSNELSSSNYGIVCLTKENISKPWIQFEAGALAKQLDSKLFVLMIDVQTSDITGPLSRYQATKLEKEDFRKLLSSINKDLDKPLPKENLDSIYNLLWTGIEEQRNIILSDVDKNIVSGISDASERDVLEEILRLTRQVSVTIENMADLPVYLPEVESSFSGPTNKEEWKLSSVIVFSEEEFAKRIRNNMVIAFEGGEYCTTDITYNSIWGFQENVFDGIQFVIENIDHLVLIGNGTKLTARPRYAQVLYFNRCSNIIIDGFILGHTKEQGTCSGNVIKFRDCSNVYLNDLSLFGCGAFGIQLINCKNIYVNGVDIYECTYGALTYSDSECFMRNVSIYNCNDCFEILDLRNSILFMDHCHIHDNINVQKFISHSNSQFIYKQLEYANNTFSLDGDNLSEGMCLDISPVEKKSGKEL